MKPIYLDYNATTPVAPEAAQAMQPFLTEHFGNPSSSHVFGLSTHNAVEKARRQVAGLIGCKPDELVFTSGGTESNNHALRGAALAQQSRGKHIITSAIEHPAVSEVFRWLGQLGFQVTTLPVDSDGIIDPVTLRRAITPQTILVSFMHANNETGSIQPICELAEIAHRSGALVHSDAAQSVGKIPVQVKELGVDLLSIAGHKLYAPKGIGALYIRQGLQIPPLLYGAGHEKGQRPGTENVLGIVGLGEACQIAQQNLTQDYQQVQSLRERLHTGLIHHLGNENILLNGHPQKRLPNTLNLSFKGIEAQSLLSAIGAQIAASAGAACHAGKISQSTVLRAMNVPKEWAKSALRFSAGRFTTEQDIENAIQIISQAIQQISKE